MGSTNDIPLRFVDSLDTKKHMVLFYNNPEYAQRIEFQFLKRGLEKGEHCIYAMSEDTKFVKEKMVSYGIPVGELLEKKTLHIYQLSDPLDDPEGPMRGAEKSTKMIMADLKSSFRIVSNLFPNEKTDEAISAHLAIEHNFHVAFDKFQGSVMCPYNIENVKEDKRKEWFDGLFDNHHTAIYAPKFGRGGVFDLG